MPTTQRILVTVILTMLGFPEPDIHAGRRQSSFSTQPELLPSSFFQTPGSPAEIAGLIVENALVAYGGQSRILSFRNATFEYQVESLGENSSKPVQVKAFFKDANCFRTEVAGEESDAITVVNSNNGWVMVGDTTLSLDRKTLDPVKTSIVSQLRPDLLLVSLQKFRYAGKGDESGLLFDLVDVSGFLGGEYLRGRLYFDSTTHLIHKYEFEIERELPNGKGIVSGEETYMSYLEAEGLKVPREINSRQGSRQSRIKVQRVDFTSVLSPSLFEDPSPRSKVPVLPKH